MTWLRVDDQLAFAASTIAAGNAAMGAWVRMSAWSAAQLADGAVPRAVAGTMATSTELAALVAAGLLLEHGEVYEIVGYLDTNPSRAEVLAQREARRAGGIAGAARRWGPDGSSHGSSDGSTHDSSHGSTQGGTHRNVDAPVPSRPVPARSRPVPDQIPLPTTKEETSPPASADSDESARSSELRRVFDHWAAARARVTGCTVASLKLTKERRGKIQARLREGYTVEQLWKAIDGCLGNNWNVERHHTDIELICRDGAHVDRYMQGPPKTNGAGPPKQSSEGRAWRVGGES